MPCSIMPAMTGFSPNPVTDVQQLLSYHFMLNALRAGTVVAVLCGAIGYFMVLRRQSFAGHTLAVAAGDRSFRKCWRTPRAVVTL